MATRPTTRLVLLSTFALLFVIYLIFLQPRGPESPAARAPGHLTDAKSTIPLSLGLSEDVLKGDVVMPKLANETAKYVFLGWSPDHGCQSIQMNGFDHMS